MKKFIYISLIAILFTACKSTSPIVTSKDDAAKKGLYTPNKNTIATSKSVATTKGNASAKSTSNPNTKSTPAAKSKFTLSETDDSEYALDNDNSPYIAKQLLYTAHEFNGVKYRGGGTTRAGMDCSGLVYTCFKEYDITLPRSSNDMAKVGRKLKKDEIRKGDLIFFKTNGRSVINHVGIVSEVKDDEIIFIHSSTQRGVIYSSTKEPYYQRTFAQVNRVID